MSIRVEAFVFDEANEDEIAQHGFSITQIDQVLDAPFYVGANKKSGRGSHIVVGCDWGGTCIKIPIEATGVEGVWRPVTAIPCTAEDEHKLKRGIR